MQVSEAAVIVIPHPKWVEMPLLIVKPAVNATITKQEMLDSLEVPSLTMTNLSCQRHHCTDMFRPTLH